MFTPVTDNFMYDVCVLWLKPIGILLVLFEELGGNPNEMFFVRRDINYNTFECLCIQ